jgi:hypothetical protein
MPHLFKLANVAVVVVVDRIAKKNKFATPADCRKIILLVAASSQIVTTSKHYKIARAILEAGIHFFIKRGNNNMVARSCFYPTTCFEVSHPASKTFARHT